MQFYLVAASYANARKNLMKVPRSRILLEDRPTWNHEVKLWQGGNHMGPDRLVHSNEAQFSLGLFKYRISTRSSYNKCFSSKIILFHLLKCRQNVRDRSLLNNSTLLLFSNKIFSIPGFVQFIHSRPSDNQMQKYLMFISCIHIVTTNAWCHIIYIKQKRFQT